MAGLRSWISLQGSMLFIIFSFAQIVSSSPTVQTTSRPATVSTTRYMALDMLGTTPEHGTEYITVDAPMNNETVMPGETVTLNCRIRGYPKPTYWWYRNDAIINNNAGRYTVREFNGGSTLSINDVGTLDTGTYQCIAANGETRTVEGSITLSANSQTYSESSDSDYFSLSADEPQCEPYRGTVCRPHIANSQVYIDAGQSQSTIEASLTAAIEQINSDLPVTLSDRCTKYLKPSMCLTAFPLCRERPRLAVHRMCPDECRLLETEICLPLFEYVDVNSEVALVDMLPICSELPNIQGSNSENSCLNMGMSQPGGKSFYYCFCFIKIVVVILICCEKNY